MQRSEMAEKHANRDQQAPASRRTRLENRAPLLALGVILLVFLVALGSSRSLAHVSGPADLEKAKIVVGDVIFLLVGVLVIPAVLFVIWQSISELRDEAVPSVEKKREWRAVKQVLVIALVGGVLAALALTRDPNNTEPNQPPGSARAHAAKVKPDEAPLKLAEDLYPWVLGGVGACLVLLSAVALVQRRRRDEAVQEQPEDELESSRRELSELVGISIAEIEREADPRRAVIRAYAGMESTLSRHGLGRRPFEAPGEYLSRAFSALRLSRRPGERLTQLFEQARFSTHAIGLEMKNEAIAALSELRSELKGKSR